MDMWPSCRYHRTKGSRLFQTKAEYDQVQKEELASGGEGWFDTPAAFKDPEKGSVTVEQALGPPPPPETGTIFTEKQVKKMLKRPIYDLLKNVFKVELGEYDDCRVTALKEQLLEQMAAAAGGEKSEEKTGEPETNSEDNSDPSAEKG